MRGRQASPKGVPVRYVMQPFEVKLSYNGKSWTTVPLEVGHNEIGDAEEPDMRVPKEVSNVFVSPGFSPLNPMPFMKLTHQVAQKLRGLMEDGSECAHDLVDLQVIMAEEPPSLEDIKPICVGLFSCRGTQSWPPRIEAQPGWSEGYASASEGLPVLGFEEVVVWSNDLIERIDSV